jgi:hypothetical protein
MKLAKSPSCCVVQSEHSQVRKYGQTTRQFAKDVPDTVVSYHDVDDAAKRIIREGMELLYKVR